jgi:type II secretory pathway component GspD/PulD (secretin)
VIGGIYIESESQSEDRVPGLGRIPVLGNLFKTTSKIQDTREILFFITARVQDTARLIDSAGLEQTGGDEDSGSSAPAQE